MYVFDTNKFTILNRFNRLTTLLIWFTKTSHSFNFLLKQAAVHEYMFLIYQIKIFFWTILKLWVLLFLFQTHIVFQSFNFLFWSNIKSSLLMYVFERIFNAFQFLSIHIYINTASLLLWVNRIYSNLFYFCRNLSKELKFLFALTDRFNPWIAGRNLETQVSKSLYWSLSFHSSNFETMNVLLLEQELYKCSVPLDWRFA